MPYLKLYPKEHSLTYNDKQMVEALKAVSYRTKRLNRGSIVEPTWRCNLLSPCHHHTSTLLSFQRQLYNLMLDAHGHLSLSSPPFTDPLVLMEEIFVSYPTQKHLSIVTTNSKLEHSEFRKYLCKTLGNCLHGKQGRRHCKHWFCKTELHLNYLYFSATRRQDKTDWAFFESKTCSTERWWLRNGLSWSIIWAHLV